MASAAKHMVQVKSAALAPPTLPPARRRDQDILLRSWTSVASSRRRVAVALLEILQYTLELCGF